MCESENDSLSNMEAEVIRYLEDEMEEAREEKALSEFKESRIRALGFLPQKEIIYNLILPYSREIDAESGAFFAEIAINIGKSILINELKPACSVWTSRLIKYIRLYGLKFSKEDHISLVKMMYEMLKIENLDPAKLHKFATLFILLTKKKYLISPDDLTLEWKPLYKISQKIYYHSHADIGMYQLSPTLVHTFDMVVQCSRPYFPDTATAEILAELTPKLTPWLTSQKESAVDDLLLYLPLTLPPSKFHLGPGLWFNDFMKLWETCNNVPPWESDMMTLMALLSQNYIGYIDWEPYMPMMFTRILRSFNLPVAYKNTQSNKMHQLDTNVVCLWIVSTIVPNSSTMDRLSQLLRVMETYLQSANFGRWSGRLRDFLKRLSNQFVDRLHKERNLKWRSSWEPKAEPRHRLTDEDVEKFVNRVLKLLLQAMYSRVGINETCATLQHLASLRPDLVVEPLIQRLWDTVESLTEPHKYTCALQCVAAIARPIAMGLETGCPTGPLNIIPMLFSSLPGLDPNDLKKTMITMHFILTFCTLVPIVNCSQAVTLHKLTEDEVALCWTTSQFEDFVLQFLDKLFALIECSLLLTKHQQQDVTKSKSEEISENAIGATATVVLMQCEPKIFAAALHKMYQFISQNTLETTVAGRAAGALCKAFVKADTSLTLKVILPRLCNSMYVMIDDAVIDEQSCTPQLLHTLLMFTYLLEGDGNAMLPYMDNITRVLDTALCVRKKEVYVFASQALANVLHGLSRTFPKEFRSNSHWYGDILHSLPVRHWGSAPKPLESDIQWHIPSTEELECAQMLMDRYLSRVLAGLRAFLNDEEVSKETMHRHLVPLQALLSCSVFMPLDTSPPVDLINSKIPVTPFMCYTGEERELTCEGGANVRDVVAKVLFQVQDKLLASREDDHECLGALSVIWDNLARIPGRGSRSYVGGNIAFFAGHGWSIAALDARYRALAVAKQAFSGRRGRFKQDYLIRSLLADRALLQHELRTEIRNTAAMTEQTVQIMKYLLTLSSSRYSSVRVKAQMRLNHMLTQFAYSYQVIIPDILRLLQSDPEREHHMLKASLYILCGPKSSPLIIHNDWKVVAQLWPAIIESQKSEKPSIGRLLETLLDLIVGHFVTLSIKVTIPESVKEAARNLIPQEVLQSEETQILIASGSTTLQREYEENLNIYTGLVDKMFSLVQNPRLHWRHIDIATNILPVLVNPEVPYPASAVACIFKCLILHESIYVRKIAIRLAVYVMEQMKPARVTTEVDPYQIARVTKPTEIIPGHRADNAWIMYDPEDLPNNVEKWQNTTFVHKGAGGYYKWPEKLTVVFETQQPEYDSAKDPFLSHKMIIYDFFKDTDNMEKLITYLSMEEKKGRDRFNTFIYKMFKGLFRNFGYDVVQFFLAHLTTLLENDEETAQRCASEIIAALIHGTKQWPFEMVEKFWTDLTPIIKTSILYTSKSVFDWATSYYTATISIDPRRLHHFYTLLIDDILPDVSDNSPETWVKVRQTPAHRLVSQILCLEKVFAFGNFRMAKFCNLMLERLIALGYLSHPFQNIRERIGGLLTCIFELDMKLEKPSVGPHLSTFMETVVTILKPLYDETGEVIPTKLGYDGNPVSNSAIGSDLASGSDPASGSDSASGSNLVMDLNLAVPGVSDPPSDSNLAANEEEEPALLLPSMQALGKLNFPQKFVQALENMDLSSGTNTPDEVNEISWKFLEALKTFKMEEASDTNAPLPVQKPAANGNGITPGNDIFTENEYDVAVRTLKTVLKCTINSVIRQSYGGHPAHYLLFSTACAFGGRASQSSTMGKIPADEELCQLSNQYLGVLSQTFHTIGVISVALQHITRVLQMKSWLTKMACLSFLQTLVFHHLPMVLEQQVFRFYTLSLVEECTSDPSLEVRTIAAKVLTGFLHCGLVTNENKFVDDLRVKCREIGRVQANEPARIVMLHSYILGLCAYVEFKPYGLPPKLHETFRILKVFLNAPSPIPETIRKSIGNFRRTHYAEWQTFKLSFTEDELEMLNDLSVVPSYLT